MEWMSITLQRIPTNITDIFESVPLNWHGSSLFSTAASCALLATFISIIFAALSLFSLSKRDVLRKTPFLGSLGFFSARHEFMDATLQISQERQRRRGKDPQRGGTYAFKIANFKVNVLHGEVGRKMFFGDKNLSLYQGYLFLRGGFPTTSKIGEEVEPDNDKLKIRLLHFVRREYLSDILPAILKDIKFELNSWSLSGKMDPYNTIYTFLFQLTCRVLVCTELAEDSELLSRVRNLYWTIENAANSVTNLLPWFNTKGKKSSENATKELASIIIGIITARKTEGRRENDPLQYLMDLQDSDAEICQYVFKIIFAASLNTAAISAWVLVYLSMHPEQAEAALTELRRLTDTAGFDGTIAERLDHVPLDDWEGGMPILDGIIKETIRVVFAILALRRNVSDAVTIDGNKISKGEFLAYPIHDVHLNDGLYPEPEKWKPDRWQENRNQTTTWPFLGWGVARFPCTGMRVAKLEIKTIVAQCIATFKLEAIDSSGKPLSKDPQPNRNDWQKFMPQEHVALKYKRRGIKGEQTNI